MGNGAGSRAVPKLKSAGVVKSGMPSAGGAGQLRFKEGPAEGMEAYRFSCGRSAVGMPPPGVYEGTDGVLVLYNGVTRATRIAKLAPGTPIRVEVIGKLPKALAGEPKIGDLLP